MIITENTELGRETIIIDKKTCGLYGKIKSFNTETCEAEIYVSVEERGYYDLFYEMKERYKPQDKIRRKRSAFVTSLEDEKLIATTVKVVLKNSVAVNKYTGEEIS